MSAPIRHDVIKYVVAQISKNKRQAHGIQRRAGHKHSAESWGTGRAVSRIPRVSGGGTHASGSGAFGNMCRGGHMFAMTKVFRRLHVAVPRRIRRTAVASAIAATSIAPLVAARGHKIEGIPEVPLVVSDALETISKTKEAVQFLGKIGALADAERAADTVHMRAGKGKFRNRRYVTRKGPLVVCKDATSAARAFRNLPGVKAVSVSRLSVLDLAPGGHIGRLVIWSESALKELDIIYGTSSDAASTKKAKFHIPRSIMTNADVTSIVNRDEIQSTLRPKREQRSKAIPTVNPLRNRKHLLKLDPVAATTSGARKATVKITKSREARRKERLHALRALVASSKAGGKK
jgi:large subunit ribosomal protein L4e